MQQLLSGSLDKISAEGFIEGWAVSEKNYFDTVSIGVSRTDKMDKLLGAGTANLFREDLAAKHVGHGWHAFRIRLDQIIDPRQIVKLSLVDLKTYSLIAIADLPCPEAYTLPQLDVDALLGLDNDYAVTDFSSLKLIEPAIETFIQTHGLEEFIEYGYCYVLGRPADSHGRAHYGALVASREVAPITFLSILFDSEERRESKWAVLPPSDPAFIFAPKRL